MSAAQEEVVSLVRGALLELLSGYGLDARESDSSATVDGEMAAIVGFSGEKARGALLLMLSRTALSRTVPTRDAPPRDWLGELGNQLMGRVKNQLLRRGLEVYLTTPIVIRGQNLGPATQLGMVAVRWDTEAGAACVWVDVELDPSVDLSVVSGDDAVDEGSMLLF